MRHRIAQAASRKFRHQARRSRAAYLEFLEARQLLSYTGADVSGTWSLAAMGATGIYQFNSAGSLVDGAVQFADGTSATPTGGYVVGPVSGVLSITNNGTTGSGAMDSAKDLIAITTPGGHGDFSNSLSLLVKHTATTFSDTDLNGTWQLFTNGDGSDNSGYGSIIFDGSGNVTSGSSLGASGAATITTGNYTVSSTGQVTVDISILESDQITMGSASLTGWINDSKDTIALSPTDIAGAADNGATRLVVMVHDSGTYSNADLDTTWEFTGDGYNGTMTFDGAGHLAGNGINSDGSAMTLTGTYAVASDGTFTVALTVDESGEEGLVNLNGAIDGGRNFAAMSQTPFDNGSHSSADSLMLLVNTGGLTSARGVAGGWTYAGTDQGGSIEFDDASVAPTGTASSEVAGNIIGGSLIDTNDAISTPAGTYTLTANGGIVITAGDTRAGSYNSSKNVIAVNNPDLDETLTVLVSGGTASFTNSDLSGTWTFDFNTPTSSGSGTVSFDGQGDVNSGTLKSGSTTSSITGGDYLVNADGTCIVTLDVSGQGSLNFVGGLNSQKDVLALAPSDPQDAAANQLPNLMLMVRSAGTYNNASVAGPWTLTTEGGIGNVILDGAGHVSSGSFTDSQGDVSAITGTYSVAAAGTFTISAHMPGGTETFTGAINASRNVMIENGVTSGGGRGSVAVLLSATNRAPTMTAVNPLNVAAIGQTFTFGGASLLASSNAADLDADALTFKITSLGAGTLTVDGSPAAAGQTITSVDTLTWTPPSGTGGTYAAFSLSVSDGSTSSSAAVPVAINTIVAVNYTGGDLNNFWTLSGTGAEGSLAFDGAGNISGGSTTDNQGNVGVPSGTYSIDPSGALTIDSVNGALNASKDVAAVSNQDSDSLSVLVDSQLGSNYSDADLAGTWTVQFTGQDPGSNGGGTFTFDGAGHITGGSIRTSSTKSGESSFAVIGTYNVAVDGTVTLSVTNKSTQDSISLHGALDDSKDLAALSADDLAAATANNMPVLMVVVRSAGSYSNADAKGTWFINGDNTNGFVTLDGAGHISNGAVQVKNNGVESLATLSGTYTVSSTGRVTLNIAVKSGAMSQTVIFAGGLNANRNMMVTNSTASHNGDNLTIFTSTQDHAPTLKTIPILQTAIGTQPFSIDVGQLIASSDASDADGDLVHFQVTSLGAGTFTLNGDPAPAVPFVISSGDTLVWTPPATAKGNVTAFSVKAFDGMIPSATAVPVVVKTVLPPTISIAATKSAASEVNGLTTGAGKFTITRANGDITKSLTADYSIGGNATNGTDYNTIGGSVNFTAGQTTAIVMINPIADTLLEGTETVTLTITKDDPDNPTYLISPTKAAATVNIADVIATPAALAGASKNTPFTITYDDLINALDVQSGLSLPITFKIVGIKSGTLKINGNAVKVNITTVVGGGTLTWTPGTNATGTKAAFAVTLSDGVHTSIALTVSVIVT